MNGATIQQTAVVGNIPTNWIIVGADMKGDIFWRNCVTGEVGMWVMEGPQIALSFRDDLGRRGWPHPAARAESADVRFSLKAAVTADCEN